MTASGIQEGAADFERRRFLEAQDGVAAAEAALEKARRERNLAMGAWFDARAASQPPYPHRVAPKCSCRAGSTCQHAPCCYHQRTVPENAQDPLDRVEDGAAGR